MSSRGGTELRVRTVRAEALMREAFAPFGTVLSRGLKQMTVGLCGDDLIVDSP